MRWQPDAIDLLCRDWAQQRRKMLGILLGEMIEPSERLGKMRSTLGAVREEGEGAAYSKESQSWPEVYLGDLLLVHRCYTEFPGEWRLVMHLQYVWREIPIPTKCESIKMSVTRYGDILDRLKGALAGYLRGQGVKISWLK